MTSPAPEAAPPPARPAIERLFDLVCRAALVAAGLGLCLLIASFGWLVWGRYMLNDTPTWVEQLALLLVIWISFIVSAVLVREDRHLAVEMFRDALPARLRAALHVVTDLLLLAFGAIMAWYSASLAAFGWDTRIPLIGLPEGLKAVPLALCGGLIAAFTAARLVRRLGGAWGR